MQKLERDQHGEETEGNSSIQGHTSFMPGGMTKTQNENP